MCWITRQKWRTRPRIAKKKIEVWKVYIKRSLGSEEYLVSPYQKERIYSDMRNRPLSIDRDLYIIDHDIYWSKTDDKIIRCVVNWEIWHGYHSYKKGCLRLTRTKIVDTIQSCCGTLEEYTSFRDSDRKYVVVKCYIPVGTEYYVSEYGHYVSNKIIVGGIIPDEDLLQR